MSAKDDGVKRPVTSSMGVRADDARKGKIEKGKTKLGRVIDTTTGNTLHPITR